VKGEGEGEERREGTGGRPSLQRGEGGGPGRTSVAIYPRHPLTRYAPAHWARPGTRNSYSLARALVGTPQQPRHTTLPAWLPARPPYRRRRARPRSIVPAPRRRHGSAAPPIPHPASLATRPRCHRPAPPVPARRQGLARTAFHALPAGAPRMTPCSCIMRLPAPIRRAPASGPAPPTLRNAPGRRSRQAPVPPSPSLPPSVCHPPWHPPTAPV
jgi:hypothetical protein